MSKFADSEVGHGAREVHDAPGRPRGEELDWRAAKEQRHRQLAEAGSTMAIEHSRLFVRHGIRTTGMRAVQTRRQETKTIENRRIPRRSGRLAARRSPGTRRRANSTTRDDGGGSEPGDPDGPGDRLEGHLRVEPPRRGELLHVSQFLIPVLERLGGAR